MLKLIEQTKGRSWWGDEWSCSSTNDNFNADCFQFARKTTAFETTSNELEPFRVALIEIVMGVDIPSINFRQLCGKV